MSITTKSSPCIYIIKSKIKPNRFYIGSALNYKRRRKLHLQQLRRGIHHSIKLQRHYNKYGRGDLEFSILELCSSDMILPIEQRYIDELTPLFNICKIAGNTLGYKHSSATKKRMSISKKGKPIMREWTKEQRLAVSQRRLGAKASEETKAKMRLRKKSMLGKKHRPESIEKMRAIKLGKKMSQSMKDKARSRLLNNPIYRGRKVIDNIDGKIYSSIKEAAIINGLNLSSLSAMLRGRFFNKTNLEFYRTKS